MDQNHLMKICDFIKNLYSNQSYIPLHAPHFLGNEKKYLNECIDSTYVSYVGEFVTKFEDKIKSLTGSKYAVAITNGTLALHTALNLLGTNQNHEIITQALTFVATANAISYTGAKPIFIDSEKESLGMCPEKLEYFLQKQTLIKDDGYTYNKITGKKIIGCIPVHIFGHPLKIDKIVSICKKRKITVIEDAAESLGSYYKGIHTGNFGDMAILSFNGNKIVTTGGGGMLITNNESFAERAKFITTTAKKAHAWEFFHEEIGYNYRMPNINAAVGFAQMEYFDKIIENKRLTASLYFDFFNEMGIPFIKETSDRKCNYWLNAILLKNREERDLFLKTTNKNGIQTRPIWKLMNKLPMYTNCQTGNLENADWLEDRVVNIPSSYR